MAVDGLQRDVFDEFANVLPQDAGFTRFECKTNLDLMRHLVFVMQQFSFSLFNEHVIGFSARQVLNGPQPHDEDVVLAAQRCQLIDNKHLRESIPFSSSQSDDPDIAAIITKIKEEGERDAESFLDLLFTACKKKIYDSPAINWAIIQILRGITVTSSPVPYLSNTPLPGPGWDEANPVVSRLVGTLYICASLPYDEKRHVYFSPFIKVLEKLEGKHGKREFFLQKLKEIVPEGIEAPSWPKEKIDPQALQKLISYRSGERQIENYQTMLEELRELTAQVLASFQSVQWAISTGTMQQLC